MNSYVLETNLLTKTYGNTNALDHVTLALRPGKIYGLIGQNGAGKTTFMRLIAGLIFPSSGSFRLFGSETAKDLQRVRQRVGFMIEAPAVNPSMTAKENLHLHRIIKGIPNQELETELLDLVGLGSTGRKKARNFSLGMMQRLGIALAMIGSPELLILDEPINGLDPVGIVDVRRILKKLCEEQNITILLSSHNLSELHQTATDYIILDKGAIVKTLTQQELEEQCRQYILIRSETPDMAVNVIEGELQTQNYLVMPDRSIHLFGQDDKIDEVAKAFHRNNILITNLSLTGNTLENYYMSLIGGER